MDENDLRIMAEEVLKQAPLSKELDQAAVKEAETFLGRMGKVFKAQYQAQNGKRGLGAFLAYVYHEGIQLGMRLEIVNGLLSRRKIL